MKLCLESMWSMLILFLFTFLFGSMMSAELYVLSARGRLFEYANRIECSEDWTVESELCRKEAKEKGYELHIHELSGDETHPCLRLVLSYELKTHLPGVDEKELKGDVETFVR